MSPIQTLKEKIPVFPAGFQNFSNTYQLHIYSLMQQIRYDERAELVPIVKYLA